ncbi:TrkA family potassium uptake protein [Candidatus Bipolaricaulota bacterium]|nr:TrkA family potassium uptake protein [Candidatus Bipolaricaulota bacterium]MCK4599452.1 TrkA family potassium uptake protein [Candidatus Bipolaricaulota bacterium]
MYMIIVGAGSIGTSLIDIAVREKNNVVVIDASPDRAREISNKYDITVLNGDATSAETLREAGSERADALIATTSDDAVNLMVVSIAEGLRIPSIVSVVNDKEHAEFFRKLGANVMENPEDVVANHLYNAVKRPKVKDFTVLSHGDQIFRLTINEGSPLVGKSLAESTKRGSLPRSILVITLERDEKREIPTGETVIEVGDILTLFSLERASDELVEKLSG